MRIADNAADIGEVVGGSNRAVDISTVVAVRDVKCGAGIQLAENATNIGALRCAVGRNRDSGGATAGRGREQVAQGVGAATGAADKSPDVVVAGQGAAGDAEVLNRRAADGAEQALIVAGRSAVAQVAEGVTQTVENATETGNWRPGAGQRNVVGQKIFVGAAHRRQAGLIGHLGVGAAVHGERAGRGPVDLAAEAAAALGGLQVAGILAGGGAGIGG